MAVNVAELPEQTETELTETVGAELIETNPDAAADPQFPEV